MRFLTDADAQLVFAFWLGVVVVAMALVMLTVIVCMRRAMLRRERIHRQAAARWRALLEKAAGGTATGIPALPATELSGFLEAWNHVHDDLGGRIVPGLQRIARELDLAHRLQARLAHGGLHDRVVALVALGHLRDPASFDRIARHLGDRSAIVSLSAARALMLVDARRAVAMFVPQIVHRQDWSQSGVAAILKEAGPDAVSHELGEATLQANADVAPRLVRFLADVSPEAAAPVIRRILRTSQDEHLLSTCLQVVHEADDLPLVREMLGRERWHVRMHAASALGRIGVPDDEQRLLPLLSDAQWWVRYRAAQALARLPSVGDVELARIRAEQTDRFACDILDQVIAEKAMGV